MSSKKIVLVFFIFFAIFVDVGFTKDKVLTVGVWNNPNLSIVKDGEISGFVVDIFKYIAEKHNIKYKFVAGKWSDIYSDLVNGRIKALIPIGYSNSRLDFMKFTDYNYPVFMNWGIIISKSKNIRTITDLKDKRIAFVKNDIFYTGTFGMATYLKLYNIDYKPVSVSSYEEVLNLVKSDDVDVGLIARNFYNYINDRSIYETFLAFQPVRIVFAFNKNIDDRILSVFNRELANLISDKNSFYYEKYNDYFGTYYKHKKILTYLYITIVIITILLLFILLLRYIIKIKTKRLIESNNRLNTILSATPDLILIIAEDGEYLEVLTSNEELLADFRDNLLGRKVKDVIQNSIAEKIMDVIQKALDTNDIQIFRYELDVIGGKRFFEGRVKPIDLGYGKKTVLWYAMDITESVQAMRELKMEREKLNSILKSISEGVIVINKNQEIIYANKSAYEILETDNCIGKNFNDVVRLFKDGERVFLPFEDIFKKGVSFDIDKDYKVKTFSDTEKFISDSLTPYFDSESKIEGAVFVFSDVTDKVLYEREVLKSDKIETLGRFAAGLAHDFNNYLSIIKNYKGVAQ
ncbi:transporter substrate-binding domain-containing protein [Deferribacter thermophilus]|uniref:PAS domain-containing protein n=1 Tax=Deferribacter thermophilus TaxID=53573 RepID=UPI003C142F43